MRATTRRAAASSYGVRFALLLLHAALLLVRGHCSSVPLHAPVWQQRCRGHLATAAARQSAWRRSAGCRQPGCASQGVGEARSAHLKYTYMYDCLRAVHETNLKTDTVRITYNRPGTLKSRSRRAWIHCQTTDKKAVPRYCFAFSAHSQQQQ